MIKVKTFCKLIPVFDKSAELELDDVINEWLEDEWPTITDLKYSISGGTHYGVVASVLITYKERKKKKK
jgi:hypothetical protein